MRGDAAEVELAEGLDAAADLDALAGEVSALIGRFEAEDISLHLAADHPAHELDGLPEAVADRVGLTERRDLLQMRRPLPVEADHPSRLDAPTITTRSFVPGTDDDAWIRVNNRSFAGHPDQGREDRSTLMARTAEAWFDTSDFLVADEVGRGGRTEGTDRTEASSDDLTGEMSGFCWTKVHPAVPDGEAALGEIYVIGVDPRHRGEGLGPAFVLAGLDHLAARGIGTAVLYVDATNEPARRLYDRLGFTVHRRRRVYTRPASGDTTTSNAPDGGT